MKDYHKQYTQVWKSSLVCVNMKITLQDCWRVIHSKVIIHENKRKRRRNILIYTLDGSIGMYSNP